MVTVCCAKPSVIVYSAHGVWQTPNASRPRGFRPCSPETRKIHVPEEEAYGHVYSTVETKPVVFTASLSSQEATEWGYFWL